MRSLVPILLLIIANITGFFNLLVRYIPRN